MSTETPHGGLVEACLESVEAWLRLARASVRQARQVEASGAKAVEAELHGAGAERYEEAARHAERLAEACRIQAAYHRDMARVCHGERVGHP